MKLQEQQALFTQDVAKLVQFIAFQGVRVTFGEVYRTPEQAELNASKGIGIVDSLHCKRLAVDINLYKDGIYLFKSSDYHFAGKYWESLGKRNRWGGFFTNAQGKPKPDGGHFQRNLV